MLPEPKPRAAGQLFIVPPIGSRDVACSEGPYVRSFEHFLQLLDVGNDLLSVHSASIIQQKRREVKRNFVNGDDSGAKVAIDSSQQAACELHVSWEQDGISSQSVLRLRGRV